MLEGTSKITIPEQETFVATIHTEAGSQFIWMADLWESAPDAVKGHDLQYWSSPLLFDANDDILPLQFESEWHIKLR